MQGANITSFFFGRVCHSFIRSIFLLNNKNIDLFIVYHINIFIKIIIFCYFFMLCPEFY